MNEHATWTHKINITFYTVAGTIRMKIQSKSNRISGVLDKFEPNRRRCSGISAYTRNISIRVASNITDVWGFIPFTRKMENFSIVRVEFFSFYRITQLRTINNAARHLTYCRLRFISQRHRILFPFKANFEYPLLQCSSQATGVRQYISYFLVKYQVHKGLRAWVNYPNVGEAGRKFK